MSAPSVGRLDGNSTDYSAANQPGSVVGGHDLSELTSPEPAPYLGGRQNHQHRTRPAHEIDFALVSRRDREMPNGG